MQSMDWQTVVARRVKRDPPTQGGWNAMLTSWVAADILNPVMAGFFNASGDKAAFGWPSDPEIETLRAALCPAPTRRPSSKQIAEAVQRRVSETPTHVHLVGQWYSPGAHAPRTSRAGSKRPPRCSGTSRRAAAHEELTTGGRVLPAGAGLCPLQSGVTCYDIVYRFVALRRPSPCWSPSRSWSS